MAVSHEVIERDISPDHVINLREILCTDPKTKDDFQRIEDLVIGAAFSQFEARRMASAKILSDFMRTPVQIYKITAETGTYLYLTFNGIEDEFFFVGSYLSDQSRLEPALTQEEIDLSKEFADSRDAKEMGAETAS